MSTETIDCMIIRIGDISKNFKHSVLDRIPLSGTGSDKENPIWGYNSEKCCGLQPVSLAIHSILRTSPNMYAFFLPNNKSPFIGIAKIYISENRESTNEENGWTEPTAMGITDWNIQINIEKFWDLREIPFIDSLFSYATINNINGARLPQSSLIYKPNPENPLKMYLIKQLEYITQFIKPTYVNMRRLE
jgi:hypothetical protein